jgi:tetratricopeptide (TPR) repeat protein
MGGVGKKRPGHSFGWAEGALRGNRWRWIIALWSLGLLALYLLTLTPSIAWNDAPEFVDVVYTLGIPHPPGYPTYTLLGKLITLIPLGALAPRVNLLSALCASGALVFLSLSIARLHVRIGGREKAGRLAAILCGTLLAVAPTYWKYAIQTEAYASFALVVTLLLYLALRWEETRDDRYLMGGAFLFGLSGGIHGTSVFFFPAFAFLVLTGLPRERMGRTLFRIALFGLLGASVYLYLPVRAATEPTFNWGHPDTWQRFWIHISDRKDAQFHFFGMSKRWWPYVKVFSKNLNTEVTAAGWGLALVGLTVILRRSPRWGLFTVLFCSGNLFFFLRDWTIPDAYLPTFCFALFWAGIGTARIIDSRRGGARLLVSGTCFALLVAIGVQTFKGSAEAGSGAQDAARSAAEANLLPLEEDSLVFLTTNWFPMRYLQDVEGMRRDVTLLLVSDLAVPEYFTPVTAKRFPKLKLPGKEAGPDRNEAFFQGLLRENLDRLPVYWEPLTELNRQVHPYLHPWRYLWRFEAGEPTELTRAEMDAYFADLRGFLQRELEWPGVLDDPGAVRLHTYLLTVSSEILRFRKRPQDALVLVELAGRLNVTDPTVANELGRLYSGFRRWKDAERMFRIAAANLPGEVVPIVNLAELQISLGRFDEAEKTIARAMDINDRAAEPYHELSVLERERGRTAASRRALKRAIALATDEREARAWRAELDSNEEQVGGQKKR